MSRTARVVVTGGAGFIGSHLVRRLRDAGHDVVIIDTLHPQVHGGVLPGVWSSVESHRLDVRDLEGVKRLVDGADVVYHLASETGVGQSQYEMARYVSVNTHGTAVVLEAAVVAKVRQFILASSRAVYGDGMVHCSACGMKAPSNGRRAIDLDNARWEVMCPECGRSAAALPMDEVDPCAPASVYGVTKLQQEQLARVTARVHNLPSTVLRFFNVYGPGQSLRNPYTGVLGAFLRCIRGGESVELYEDGQMTRDFVYVDDVVDVLYRCLGDAGVHNRTLNVGSGEAVTLRAVAEEMHRAAGREPKCAVSGRYRVGDVRHAAAAVRHLNRHFPERVRTPLGHGLARYLEWAATDSADASDCAASAELESRGLLRRAGASPS
jgi:dTDP-L-rhamnose 4-epimerase